MTGASRQKWLLALVGILLVTNIITLAFTWSTKKKPHKPDAPKPRMGQFMVDQMKFDSVQEAAYWQLRDSLMTMQKPVMDSLRSAKKDFYDLLNQPVANDSLLHVRSNEVTQLQKDLDLLTFRHFQQVRQICRPDQYQKFDTVIKEIVTRMTTFRRSNNNGKANDSSLKK